MQTFEPMNTKNRQKTVTIRQVIAAIKKNGYPQAHGMLVYSDNPVERLTGRNAYLHKDRITSACALGQAGLNLDMNPHALVNNLPYNFVKAVVEYNDRLRLKLPEIAKRLKADFADDLNEKITIKWAEDYD